VIASVQRMRRLAQSKGNLASSKQQTVVTQGSTIQILPASPEVIYVPQYNPTVVYTQPAVSAAAPLVTFALGMAVGSALDSNTTDVVVYLNWAGGWGHWYAVPPPAAYGYRGAWHGTTARGTDWNYGAAAGRTWNGGAYAARGGTAEFDNGAKAGAYHTVAGAPGVGVESSRGWGVEKDDKKAGGFSKTVVTDDGIYRVHGAGAADDGDRKGAVTVSGVNRDGDYGRRTWTTDDRSAYEGSRHVFEGYQDGQNAGAFGSRGFSSRMGGADGGRSFGGGGRSFGGGGRSFGGRGGFRR